MVTYKAGQNAAHAPRSFCNKQHLLFANSDSTSKNALVIISNNKPDFQLTLFLPTFP